MSPPTTPPPPPTTLKANPKTDHKTGNRPYKRVPLKPTPTPLDWIVDVLMRQRLALLLVIGALAACNGDGIVTSTTSESTTTTAAETTTSSTTTLVSTTTTAPPATTTTSGETSTTAAVDPPPGQITGVEATLGGGSGEIAVSWDPAPEPDVAFYNIYYSENPGGTKSLLESFDVGASQPFIDFDRSLSVGLDCYEVSAVDAGGNEGLRSVEACFVP